MATPQWYVCPQSALNSLANHCAHVQSLLDEIINSINIISERGLTSIEEGLLKAPATSLGFGKPASTTSNTKSKRKRKAPAPPPPDDEPPLSQDEIEARAHAEIASGTHQLETLLCTSIDRNFDKFEIYVMRNILCVQPEDRDWMRLGHYEGLNFENLPPAALLPSLPGTKRKKTDEDGDDDDAMDMDNPEEENNESQQTDIPTLGSVARLRRRLQASQKLNTMLVAEQARTATLLTELRAIVGQQQHSAKNAAAATQTPAPTPPPLAFLRDKGDLAQADATTPLTTTTAFALTQLQALRALSTSLGTVMPDLRAADSGGNDEGGEGGRRTWRKERVEYVEGAARKHLESVRGLELGANGEVRDGEWQGEGKRVGSVEVGALEGVVGLLGDVPGEGREVVDEKEGGHGTEAGNEEMGDGEE